MSSKVFLAGAVAVAAALGVLGHQWVESSSTGASQVGVLHDESAGAVPEGTTVFDDEVPGVVNLDPALRDALRRAGTAASTAGVPLVVESGWRSPEYQQRLLDEAVAEHGSLEEATRWVATPATSAHVSGDAVDVGPSAASAWLAEHGATFGLCRIYGNERWHFELRAEAVERGCPPPYLDASYDPRLRP